MYKPLKRNKTNFLGILFTIGFCCYGLWLFNWEWSWEKHDNNNNKDNNKDNYIHECIGVRRTLFANNEKVKESFERAYEILEKHTSKFAVHTGTMLQLYRDCGLSKDTHDIDFIVPVNEIYPIIEKFKQDGWKLDRKFGKPNEPGYELSFKLNKYNVDIFSFNEEETEFNYWPLWVNRKLRKCKLNKNINFGHQIKIGDRYFHSLGPVEQIAETIYGTSWKIPIPSKKFNWLSHKCI